jgi:hypothetical protein
MSSNRDAGKRLGGAKGEQLPVKYPVAASVVLWAGALIAIDTSGNARPARTSTTDKIAGINPRKVDNSGGAAGAKTVSGIERGTFSFKNLTGDAITAAHLLNNVYVVDDQTMAATSGGNTRVVGGKFLGFDPDITGNVLVEVG